MKTTNEMDTPTQKGEGLWSRQIHFLILIEPKLKLWYHWAGVKKSNIVIKYNMDIEQ